jgi:hypothetical protein
MVRYLEVLQPALLKASQLGRAMRRSVDTAISRRVEAISTTMCSDLLAVFQFACGSMLSCARGASPYAGSLTTRIARSSASVPRRRAISRLGIGSEDESEQAVF